MKTLSAIKRVYRGVSFILPLFVLLWSFTPAAAQSDGPNRAGLVVVHGDGSVTTRCVSFDEVEITGLELLQRSGLQWQSSNGPMGAALCTLDGEGCPASDCFCKCKQAPCAYWNYFTGNGDGSWTYSGVGTAVRTVKNGDIDGWVWGDGSTGPSPLIFERVCSGSPPDEEVATEPSPTSTPTLQPSATPTTTPSPTAVPTTRAEMEGKASPTPEPSPTVHQEPTSTRTPEPTTTPTATASALPGPTPTTSALSPAAESLSDKGLTDTPLAQIGAFSLLLGTLATIYILQRRRK